MSRFIRTYRDYLLIAVFVLISSFLVWLPFFPQMQSIGLHRAGTDTGTVYRNYDGLLYVVAAKTWYQPEAIRLLHLENNLSPTYFAAHLPGYPAFIRSLAFLGYEKAMMGASLISAIFLGWIFYALLRQYKLTDHPLLLTMMMLMLPRLLVVRSVGSPESLFMAFILLSLWMFEKKQFLLAGIFGGLATMTKVPGILLFPALGSLAVAQMITSRKIAWRTLWLLLIPGGLIAVCLIYLQQYQDLFAYWHTGYVVPMPYPFAAFDSSARWVGTHWLEDIVLYLALYLLTMVYAYHHKLRSLFAFSLAFFLGLIFVQHRDISRYALPLWPISCIIFERFLTSKKTLIALILIVPAIYLYSWAFVQGNAMPVANWGPYL